jgi:hypothetical protein
MIILLARFLIGVQDVAVVSAHLDSRPFAEHDEADGGVAMWSRHFLR